VRVGTLGGMRAGVVGVVAGTLLLGACSHVGVPHSQSASAAAKPPPTTAVSLHTPPTDPGPPIAAGTRDKPLIALTFDSNLTPAMIAELDRHRVASFDNTAVVDVLDRLHVPATFFLAGLWVERYPDTVRRLAADPLFELGSHSYAHRPFAAPCFGLGSALPVGQMAADVQHSFDVLRQYTDHPVPYFRFPGGCYNQAAIDAVAPAGVTFIQYDVASGDAFGLSVDGIVKHVLTSVKNGSIVVLHITGGNTAPLTAKALPGIVEGLRAQGFTLVKVSDLLAAGAPVRAGTTGAVGGTVKRTRTTRRRRS